jgi:EAL domain-containing protein (putative c-di-GMP-specific phosphodiesterase class I)
MEPRESAVPPPGTGPALAADPDPDRGRGRDAVGRDSGPAELLRTPQALRSVYQPIVDLRTGAVAGYEALTRVAEWPARSPKPWFAAADRQGLGAQVEAVALSSSLRARPLLASGQFLCVNVSAGALLHQDVTSTLLREPDLDGVVVELGDLAGAEPGPLAAALAGLRERGLLVAVCLDDGGRSELHQLVELRPDLVEIGPALVRGIADDAIARRVFGLVLELAADLGADVLAAGVEALEDARWLQRAGTSLGQGWLFGRARAGLLQPSPEVVDWLRATPDEA